MEVLSTTLDILDELKRESPDCSDLFTESDNRFLSAGMIPSYSDYGGPSPAHYVESVPGSRPLPAKYVEVVIVEGRGERSYMTQASAPTPEANDQESNATLRWCDPYDPLRNALREFLQKRIDVDNRKDGRKQTSRGSDGVDRADESVPARLYRAVVEENARRGRLEGVWREAVGILIATTVLEGLEHF
ncbi:MAG TPA: hypothetical protein VLG92_03385 [Candidatus Saccharimonadia bacterium]|nr:hypothetical protein [Candidatus Saccharimonadia bacterium]